MNPRFALFPAAALAALALAGCDNNNCDYCNADPAGVYAGTITDEVTHATLPVVGVIDENGDGRMMAQGGDYYRMSVGTSGYGLFGSLLAFPGSGSAASGSLSGDLTEAGLSATVTASGQDTQSLSLNYQNVYNYSPSLTALAGTWSYTSGSYTLTLTFGFSGTTFTGTDTNGCSYSNGIVGVVDPNVNAYYDTFIQTCASQTIDYSGLAYYNPGSTPQFYFFADDNSSHYLYAILQLQ